MEVLGPAHLLAPVPAQQSITEGVICVYGMPRNAWETREATARRARTGLEMRRTSREPANECSECLQNSGRGPPQMGEPGRRVPRSLLFNHIFASPLKAHHNPGFHRQLECTEAGSQGFLPRDRRAEVAPRPLQSTRATRSGINVACSAPISMLLMDIGKLALLLVGGGAIPGLASQAPAPGSEALHGTVTRRCSMTWFPCPTASAGAGIVLPRLYKILTTSIKNFFHSLRVQISDRVCGSINTSKLLHTDQDDGQRSAIALSTKNKVNRPAFFVSYKAFS